MNKEAVKQKKAQIDHEIAKAKSYIEEAKTAAAIAEQHFENILNHIRDVDEGLFLKYVCLDQQCQLRKMKA